MGYTNEEIIEILKRPRVEGEKSLALNSQKHHKLHITGEGYYHWWLGSEAQGFESKATHEKKKHICKPTTPRIFEGIQKQFSKIFRAKGDVFEYHFKDNSKEAEIKFKEILKDVSHGLSMDELMQLIWNKAMFEEFNGFFGIELEKEENLKDKLIPEPKICFYPLSEVYDVDIDGKIIEYIVLCTEVKRGDETLEAFRFIDDEKDIIYIKEAGEFKVNIINVNGIDKEDSYPNIFKKVPFVQVSNYRANVRSGFLKNSPVSKVIPNADTYLSVSDDHQVCVKKYQHPIFYSYPVTCPTCNGSKTMRVPDPENPSMWMSSDRECGGCFGEGQVSYLKGDILQGISLPTVGKYDEDGYPAAQAPAGYVTNDHESIREQRIELEDQERFIEKGALGVEGVLNRVNGNKGTSKTNTATQVEADLQPLHDTLNAYSSNAEEVRQTLTDFLGFVYFPNNYEGSYIHYGRKYFLKSEQRVVEEYQLAKDGGMNDAFLKELLEETYYVRFENNPMALKRSLMLLDIEPLPTRNKIEEIALIAPYTNPETLLIKVNFNDLIERFERELMPITMFQPNQEYSKRISEIQKQISVYAKEIKPPKPEPITNGANPAS